jgi:hypothetical protein
MAGIRGQGERGRLFPSRIALDRATYEPLRAVGEACREETEGFRGLRRGEPRRNDEREVRLADGSKR